MQNRMEYAVRVRALLRRLQRSVQFDLIHQLNPVVVGMSALLGGFGIPIVLGPLPAPGTLPLPQTAPARLKRRLLHAQMGRARLVLIPNRASLPLVPEHDGSRAKVRELHFGVHTTMFSPRRSSKPEEMNVLFLANLVERKGALLLLEAFECIAAKHPMCKLQIAGGGVQEAALKARAAKSPVAARIEFLGAVPRERVAEVLNTATVYCLPSYYEAFGMTALEAMACALPVIGTQVGGLGLLVERTSPSVPAGDRDALAAALDEFLSSSERRKQAGDDNRELALKEYDWDRVIDRLEHIYSELVPLR